MHLIRKDLRLVKIVGVCALSVKGGQKKYHSVHIPKEISGEWDGKQAFIYEIINKRHPFTGCIIISKKELGLLGKL